MFNLISGKVTEVKEAPSKETLVANVL